MPTPKEEDYTKGILEVVDLESYRLEKQNALSIILSDEDGEVEGLGIGVAKKEELELDTAENIIVDFNDIFGNIDWNDADNVKDQIQKLPDMVMKNKKFRNALNNSDEENIRREYGSALKEVLQSIINDNVELFDLWMKDPAFQNWLNTAVFDEIMKRYKKPHDNK